MELTFNASTHEYFLGEKKLISVTQLMAKHNLSPNYSSVPEKVLMAKAERGTLIHKEIEIFNKTGEIGFTTECSNFARHILTSHTDVILSEQMVNNDVVAGTIDLVLYEDGAYKIADIKTTSVLHKEAISWQLSIYAYLFNLSHKDTIVKADKGQAYHFNKEGELKVVDIPLKPFEEVEKLFECEKNGEIYQYSAANEIDLTELVEVETQIKQLQEREKELKEELFNSMEKGAMKTLENNQIRITYIDPISKTTLDSIKLKKEHPEIVEQYSKTSLSKASLRISLKEEK